MKSPDYVSPIQPLRILSWKEALAILEDCDGKGVPRPFSVIFCTADSQRGTGGEIICLERAVWHVKAGRVRRDQRPEPTQRPVDKPKARWSRTIRILESNQIRRLHAHLILFINGHPVK